MNNMNIICEDKFGIKWIEVECSKDVSILVPCNLNLSLKIILKKYEEQMEEGMQENQNDDDIRLFKKKTTY